MSKLKKVLELQKFKVTSQKGDFEPNSTFSFLCNPLSSYESVAFC